MGKKCTLLLERETRTLSEGNTRIFCDIDALAVSMSQKLLRFAEGIQSFLSKSDRIPFSKSDSFGADAVAVFDGEYSAVSGDVADGVFKLFRKMQAKLVDDYIAANAENGVFGTAHTEIGYNAGAVGKYHSVGSLDVGVSTENYVNPAVEITGERRFFRGRLGVNVQNRDAEVPLFLFENSLDRREGTAKGLHVGQAKHVHYQNALKSAVRDGIPDTRTGFGIVCGTDDEFA